MQCDSPPLRRTKNLLKTAVTFHDLFAALYVLDRPDETAHSHAEKRNDKFKIKGETCQWLYCT